MNIFERRKKCTHTHFDLSNPQNVCSNIEFSQKQKQEKCTRRSIIRMLCGKLFGNERMQKHTHTQKTAET